MEPISGNVFAAEYILKDRKSKKGKVEYLIKWKGWNSRWNTWEPSENILDHRLLDEYKDRKTKSQSRNRGQKRSAKGSSQTSRAKSQRKATKQKKSLAEEQSSDEEEREQEEEGGGGKEEDQPGTSSQESGVDVSAEESVDNPEENAVESMGEEGIEEDKEKVEESEIPGGDSTDGESSRERLTQIVEPLKHSQLEPEEQQGQPPTNTDSASSLSARPPAPAHAAEDQDEQSSSSSSSEDSDSDDSEEEPGKSTLPPHTEIQQAPDTNSGPEDLSSAHRVQEFPLQGTPSPPHLSPLEANKVPQPAQVSAAGSDTAGPAELTSLSNVVEGSGGGGGGGGLKKVVCSPQELQFPNHSSQLVTDVEVQDRGKVTIVENLRGSV